MNERIEKLIEQCTVQEFSDCTGGFETFDKQKFALLMVRECINVSEEHACWLEAQPFDPELEQYEDGIVNGIYKATAAIKQHFGVGE